MKKPPDLVVLPPPQKPIRSITLPTCFYGLECSFSAFCSFTSLIFYEFSRTFVTPYNLPRFVCRSTALNCEHHGSRLNLHDSPYLFSNVGTKSRFSLTKVKFGTANCIISLTLKPFQFWGAMEATKFVKFEIFAHEIVVKLIITALWWFQMNKVAPFLLREFKVSSYTASQDPNFVFLMTLSLKKEIYFYSKII